MTLDPREASRAERKTMDRRQFCVLSSAAVAAGLASCRAFPSAVDSIGAAPLVPAVLYKAIFDTRFSASRAFGMAAASAGRMTAAIRGDVTALWFDDLRLQWAMGRGAIAGMTTIPSLFCLQQLAKDHWMRVVVSAEHRRPDSDVDALRVHRLACNFEGNRVLPLDPQLVSWVIAA
jgi:hypothetical protein